MPYVLQIREFINDGNYDVDFYEDREHISDGYTAVVDARNRAKEGADVKFRYSLVKVDGTTESYLKNKRGTVSKDGKFIYDDGKELKLDEAKATVRPMGRRKPKKSEKFSHLLVISFDKDGARTDELFTLKDGKKEKVEIPSSRTEIDYAFDIASNGGKVEYKISSEGFPDEHGTITREGEMFSTPVTESSVKLGPDRGELA